MRPVSPRIAHFTEKEGNMMHTKKIYVREIFFVLLGVLIAALLGSCTFQACLKLPSILTF